MSLDRYLAQQWEDEHREQLTCGQWRCAIAQECRCPADDGDDELWTDDDNL